MGRVLEGVRRTLKTGSCWDDPLGRSSGATVAMSTRAQNTIDRYDEIDVLRRVAHPCGGEIAYYYGATGTPPQIRVSPTNNFSLSENIVVLQETRGRASLWGTFTMSDGSSSSASGNLQVYINRTRRPRPDRHGPN